MRFDNVSVSLQDEPRFLYEVDKGIECITDKVSVHNGHVVMVPSWPLEAQAIVMTLDITNNMAESGNTSIKVMILS